jgi:hypothetical protein
MNDQGPNVERCSRPLQGPQCAYCKAGLDLDLSRRGGIARRFCPGGDCKRRFWLEANRIGGRILQRRAKRPPTRPLPRAGGRVRDGEWPGLDNFLAAKAANGGQAHQVMLEHCLAGWA